MSDQERDQYEPVPHDDEPQVEGAAAEDDDVEAHGLPPAPARPVNSL